MIISGRVLFFFSRLNVQNNIIAGQQPNASMNNPNPFDAGAGSASNAMPRPEKKVIINVNIAIVNGGEVA